MSMASEFKANYSDISELMTVLDNECLEVDQDWEEEETTWTFEDDSKIIVNGTKVRTKQPEE